MRMSGKNKMNLYNSIALPIMELRIKRLNGECQDMDDKLFNLENEIWEKVKQSLKINNNTGE